MEFKLHAPFKPTGDQPEAIEKLAQGVKMGLDEQVLLGVTGSGKTFTMASVIEKVQRPTLVLAHNKTLAAQLCAEFKEFFPENAVEYFVSYYDYYQPEAYIPHTDTYIAKDASTNEEIDRLRLSATCALLERRDVIVVSSVSCIYGLGLVVVVVGDKVLHRVFGEKLLELRAQLRGEGLVVRQHERGALDFFDDARHREGLARAGHAEQHLLVEPQLHALRELFDGLGLVARGLEGRVQLKFHIRFPSFPAEVRCAAGRQSRRPRR